jgi:hypothetical protein
MYALGLDRGSIRLTYQNSHPSSSADIANVQVTPEMMEAAGITDEMLAAGANELAGYSPVHGYDTPEEMAARIYTVMRHVWARSKEAGQSERLSADQRERP